MQVYDDDDLYEGQRSSEVKCSRLNYVLLLPNLVGRIPDASLWKFSFGNVGISLTGSSKVESIALFRYKIVLVPDFVWLRGLFKAFVCTVTLTLLIETFVYDDDLYGGQMSSRGQLQ